MNPKTILLMGGYGNTGRPLARLLLQETDATIVLAGRNLEKAEQLSGELNRTFPGDRAKAGQVDAADSASMSQMFNGVDIVVVASSTTQYTQQIASSALVAGVDYLDIQYSPQKVAVLHSMAGQIQQAGRCFITDGGFHPGLPAWMVRYAAQSFDQLETARVGSVIKENWKHLQVEESTVIELVELFNDFEMLTFKAGTWKKANMLSTADFIRMDFGGAFGRQYCAPMMLEEMRALPAMFPTLTHTGFYVGSFNWFTDWVIVPIAMIAMKLNPKAAVKPMGQWMYWGLKTF